MWYKGPGGCSPDVPLAISDNAALLSVSTLTRFRNLNFRPGLRLDEDYSPPSRLARFWLNCSWWDCDHSSSSMSAFRFHFREFPLGFRFCFDVRSQMFHRACCRVTYLNEAKKSSSRRCAATNEEESRSCISLFARSRCLSQEINIRPTKLADRRESENAVLRIILNRRVREKETERRHC